MKTETILQILCAMMICVILLGIMFYRGYTKKFPIPPIPHNPVSTPLPQQVDYCSTHECINGKG